MTHERGDHRYYKHKFWSIISTMEFTEFDGKIEDEGRFGPMIELSADVEFDSGMLSQLFVKKKDYLEAARQEEVSDEEVLDEVAADIATAMDIIFNKVGSDYPEEGVYKKINQDQWQKTQTENMYPKYRELLWEVTDEMGDGIPSIPSLYRPFLFAVATSDNHELPPEGVVEDILSTHIDSVRSEQKSRKGVSKLKQELEGRGMNPRSAASVAKSMEKYLKSDAELDFD